MHSQAQTEGPKVDVMTAIAILCLGGALADGKATPIEIRAFTSTFKEHFMLSQELAFKITWKALQLLTDAMPVTAIDSACETLNIHCTLSQRENIFHVIEQVILADYAIHSLETSYMTLVSARLNLIQE